MNIPLSKRLLKCADFVQPGAIVADVGCDHGYLGIYLLHKGIATRVIASDVNPQPLHSAVRNAEKFGVQEKIQFFLSDGVESIPKEFDTLVCAGMGADTMISILEHAPWLRNSQYRLILQCQSKTPALRNYLSTQGWYIAQESVLRDGRFLYTVMLVYWDPGRSQLTAGQCYLPPALQISKDPELREYYQSILFRLRRAITGQQNAADPQMSAALKELELLEGEIQ